MLVLCVENLSNEGVLLAGRDWENKGKEINKLDKHPSLGRPGGLVSWIRPKAEK